MDALIIKKWGSLKKQKNSYLMILPVVLFLTVFMIIPLFGLFVMSISDFKFSQYQGMVGLKNYRIMLEDPIFWRSFLNTALFTVFTIPMVLVISLLLAILVNQKIKFRNIFRTSVFFPTISSWVVVAVIWKYLYNSEFGLLNMGLKALGFEPQLWLASTKLALPSLVNVNVWKNVGFYMVLFLAGLQGIPYELYEAGKIDGTNVWQQFRYITIPQLRSIIILAMTMLTIETFKIFDLVFIMTRGGPFFSTTTLVSYIYDTGFVSWDMSYGATIAITLFVVIIILTAIQWKLTGLNEE